LPNLLRTTAMTEVGTAKEKVNRHAQIVSPQPLPLVGRVARRVRRGFRREHGKECT